jgi:hypothetical protein
MEMAGEFLGDPEVGFYGTRGEGKDAKNAQYSFTDPESQILKGPDGFVEGYNTQIAVEPVMQAANDEQQLVPCWRRSRNSRDKNHQKLSRTLDLCSEENLKCLKKRQIAGFVAAGKQKHNERRNLANQGRYRRELAESSRWNGSYRPRLAAMADAVDLHCSSSCDDGIVLSQAGKPNAWCRFLGVFRQMSGRHQERFNAMPARSCSPAQ